MDVAKAELRVKWEELFAELGVKGEEVNVNWKGLVKRYTESHRHYHNLLHLQAIFTHLEPHRQELNHPQAVVLAVFYHDIIYSPRRKDNERQSAILAQNELTELNIPEPTIQLVYDLILATKHHQPTQPTTDFYFLLDADLAILGSESATYQWYTQAIRKEYSWVSGFLYKKGRRKVLRHFLEREQLYFTPSFRERFERQARENMERELRVM